MRLGCALAMAAVGAFASAVARAESVESCISASTTGQEQRAAGHLSDAAQQFASCSNSACPAVVRRECMRWAEEVDVVMPTVVFAATDAQGGDKSDVRVIVDGRKLLDRLDGRPLPLDPGAHTVRFEGVGVLTATREIAARVGEKNRIVSIRLKAAPAPGDGRGAAVPRAVPALAWVLGGVAVAGVGGATVFDVSAIHDVNTLRSSCAPRCSPSDVDSIDHKYAIAAVAFGTGVILAGIAVFLYIARGESRPAPAAVVGTQGASVLSTQ
jgi:hypothetical protein